jgi:hypothetical protein
VKLFRKNVPHLRSKYKPRTATTQGPSNAKWVEVNKRKVVKKKDVCDYVPWNKRQSVFLGPRVLSHYELRDGVNGEIEWVPPKPTRPPPPVPVLGTPRLVELAEELSYIPPMPMPMQMQKKKKKARKDGEVREKKSRKHDRSRPKKGKAEKDGDAREKQGRELDRSPPKKNKADGMPLIKSKSEDFLIRPEYYDPSRTKDQTFDIPMPVPMPPKKKVKKDGVSRPKKRENEKSPCLQELNEDGTPRERKTKTADRPRKKRTKNTDCAPEEQAKSPDLAVLDRKRYIKDWLPYRNMESQSLEKKIRTAGTSHEHIDNVYPQRPMKTNPDKTLHEEKTKTADQSCEKKTEEDELARKKEAYAEVLRRGNYITYAYNPFRLSPKKSSKESNTPQKEKRKRSAALLGVKARQNRVPSAGKTKNITIAHSETKQKDAVSPTEKNKNDAPLRAMKSIRDLFSREKKDEQDNGAHEQKLKKEITSRRDKIVRHTSSRNKKSRNVQFSGNRKANDAAYYAKKRQDFVSLIEHIENKLAYPVEGAYPLDRAYAVMEASSRETSPQIRSPFERKASAPVSETHNRRPSLRQETFSSPVLPTRQPTISERRGARPPARLGHRRPTPKSSVTTPAVPTATPASDRPSCIQETLRRRPTLGDLLAGILNNSTLNLCPPDETTPPVPRIPISFTSAAIGMAAPSILCKCCTFYREGIFANHI